MSRRTKPTGVEGQKGRRPGHLNRFLYRIGKCWVAGLFRLLYRVRVRGTEHIPEGGCILCANHTAFQDPLIIGSVFPREIAFLSKKELFRIPLFGAILRSVGAVSIARGSADVGALRKVISLVREGEAVAVFPQGHRFPGVNPADTPVHNGIGMIAAHTGRPVVPVCVKLHRQRYSLFHRAEVIIGPPLLYSDAVPEGAKGSAAYTQASETFFRACCALGGYYPTEPEGTVTQ